VEVFDGRDLSNIGPNIAYRPDSPIRSAGTLFSGRTGPSRLSSTGSDRGRRPATRCQRTLAIDVQRGFEAEFNRPALRAGMVKDPIGTITDVTYGFGLGYRNFH
jgi:hypothetical protein